MQWGRWMKVVGVALAIAGAAGPRLAGATETGAVAVTPPRPRIEVDEPEKDAGMIQPGHHAAFSFAIRNTGQMPLEIRKVSPDCGCVVADFDRTIPPGGIGTVRATLKTGSRRGQLVKHLKVESNDPEKPFVALTMSARVFEPISIFPGDQILLPLMPNRMAMVEVVVRCNEPEPLEIQKVEVSDPTLQVRLLPIAPGAPAADRSREAQQPDRRLEIVVPKTASPKAFDATVTLHVNRPAKPKIVLHVVGYPHTSVVANPPRLYFGEILPGDRLPIQRVITLFRRGGSFQVLSVTTQDPALELRVETGPEGGDLADVRVFYRGGWQPGEVSGVITIRTDDPARPVIVVPYEALVGG